MTRRAILLVCLLVLGWVGVPYGADEEQEYASFEELSAAVNELWAAEKRAEAAELFRSGLELFPDQAYAITSTLVQMYLRLEQVEKAFEIFEYGLDAGLYYPIYTKSGPMAALLEHERFVKIVARNSALIAQAQVQSRSRSDVVTPAGYDPAKKYPLLVVLHGYGGGIASSKAQWTSDKLAQEFIVVYLQSSQIVGMGMFGWNDLGLAQQDLGTAYEKVIEQYSVDPDRVIIGGFSQGGMVAIKSTLKNVLPAAGFIAHCPGGGLSEGLTSAEAESAAQRGLRGTILTGKIDHSQAEQKELVDLFKGADLPCRYIVIPDLGHWYPGDFAAHINTALEDILVGVSEQFNE